MSEMAVDGRRESELWDKMLVFGHLCEIKYRGRNLLSTRQFSKLLLAPLERFKCEKGANGSALRRVKGYSGRRLHLVYDNFHWRWGAMSERDSLQQTGLT